MQNLRAFVWRKREPKSAFVEKNDKYKVCLGQILTHTPANNSYFVFDFRPFFFNFLQITRLLTSFYLKKQQCYHPPLGQLIALKFSDHPMFSSLPPFSYFFLSHRANYYFIGGGRGGFFLCVFF